MRRFRFSLACFLALCVTAPLACAQDVDPEALAESRKILEATNTRSMGDQMITLLMPQVLNLIEKANPERAPEVRALMSEYFEPSLRQSLPELIDDCAMIYARLFTAAELKELSAFYETPLGQKLIQTQPVLVIELNQAGQRWGMTASQRALQKLAPILRDRGLNVPI